jgi:excinuclease ABC subunit A
VKQIINFARVKMILFTEKYKFYNQIIRSPIIVCHIQVLRNIIEIQNARVHNLKNISLKIPLNKFVVVTGVSGSGKSSLAFDTLFAEGQRRYVESLSSYARQFLGRINKPEVDFIKGIPPAIAIEQKVNTRNPRSTVGTSTEIYDYLKLFYARIGKTISPVSGEVVKRESVSDVLNFINSFQKESRVIIAAPLVPKNGRSVLQEAELLMQQGFSRLEINDEILSIDELINEKLEKSCTGNCNIVIDRVSVNFDDDTQSRMADSVETAFFEGRGECIVKVFQEDKIVSRSFSNLFEADGIEFEEPSVHMFSFNNPVGACPACEGYGKVIGIDEDLVIPNKSLSIYQDAVACWKGDKMKEWKDELVICSRKIQFPHSQTFLRINPGTAAAALDRQQILPGPERIFQNAGGKCL